MDLKYGNFMIKLNSILEELEKVKNPIFKRWFGNSKVIDSNGNPLMVFHGTKTPVSQFLHKHIGSSSTILGNYENERYGIFAAEDPKLAQDYMERNSDGKGVIMPLYMRIEHPLDATKSYSDELWNTIEKGANNLGLDGYRFARWFGDKWGRGYLWTIFDTDEGNDPEIWIKLFKSLGFDGMKIHERIEDSNIKSETWVAFDPEQVKFANESVKENFNK